MSETCPDCKGTGRIRLFTSDEPCPRGCPAPGSEPADPAANYRQADPAANYHLGLATAPTGNCRGFELALDCPDCAPLPEATGLEIDGIVNCMECRKSASRLRLDGSCIHCGGPIEILAARLKLEASRWRSAGWQWAGGCKSAQSDLEEMIAEFNAMAREYLRRGMHACAEKMSRRANTLIQVLATLRDPA